MNDTPNFPGDEQAHRIAYLVAGFVRKTLTEKEHDELDAWVEASDENMRLFEELTDENNIAANLRWMDEVNTKRKLQEVKKGLVFKDAKPQRSKRMWPYATAASIIFLVIAGYLVQRQNETPTITPANAVAEILPAKGEVVLQLGNGKSINLNTAVSGSLNTSDGSTAKNDEGALRYEQSGSVVTHTLSTSTGGKYQLTLADGTKVWLNASSSISYPTAFVSSERVVILKGEAYFEVAKDASKPFLVKLSERETVTVLGTHFNIQNYSDEITRAVTLVEGKVKVGQGERSLVLSPSEQASISSDEVKLAKKADLEEVTGWKDDLFVFHDADIKTIMRQVARWYDTEIIYQNDIPQMFNATISRKEPLSKLLKLLELTGKVNFKTENKKIYVLQ